MTKRKIMSRLKKYKKKEEVSYETLSKQMGFSSAMTSYNYINKDLPKHKRAFVDSFLANRGY